MEKFLKIASDLGWEQVESNIMVFKKEDRDDYININFVTCESYDNFDLNDSRINKEFVNNYITKIGCCNKVKKCDLKWGIPLLISDYFGHRNKKDEELYWAKKAINMNPKLSAKMFSKDLIDKL